MKKYLSNLHGLSYLGGAGLAISVALFTIKMFYVREQAHTGLGDIGFLAFLPFILALVLLILYGIPKIITKVLQKKGVVVDNKAKNTVYSLISLGVIIPPILFVMGEFADVNFISIEDLFSPYSIGVIQSSVTLLILISLHTYLIKISPFTYLVLALVTFLSAFYIWYLTPLFICTVLGIYIDMHTKKPRFVRGN